MKKIFWMLVLLLSAAGAVSAQKNFYDKQNKVGFKYPSTWKLAKPEKSDTSAAPGDMKEIAEVSMPDKLYPKTNYEGGKATLLALAAPKGGCAAILADGYEKPVKWRTVTVGGRKFLRFDDGDGATGHYYTRRTFRTLRGGTCYEVVLEVATVNVGMLPHKVKDVNIPTVLASLETIVRSLYF